MKMKSKKKAIILSVCVILLVVATAIGTIAYLTDTSSVVNTFTVGKVEISLDETDIDNDSNTKANEYHLVPGNEYVKDPTVTMQAGSEESYVRMIMTVHNYSAVKAMIADQKNGLTEFADLLGGMDETVWLYEGASEDTTANTISFEYRYYTTADGRADDGSAQDQALPALFTTLRIPGEVTVDELKALYGDGGQDAFKIVLEAHAIQAAGFENNEDGAWAAFTQQINN